MAAKFEQEQSIYFLFHNGQTAIDSQLKPRYYKTKDRAKKYSLDGYYDVVEYAPVRHGKWQDIARYNDGERVIATCSYCKDRGELRTARTEFGLWVVDSPCCSNCGARMDGDE